MANAIAFILVVCGLTMAERAQDIWALIDLVASPAFETAHPDDARAVLAKVQDHQIERFERLSANPGVYGNRGASPKQLDFQKVFFARQYRVFAALGSNQCGKTELIGGMCFCKWLRDRAMDGDVYWVIAQRNEDLRNIPAKTLWNFLPRSMFPAGVSYTPKLGFGSIQTLHLILPEGRGRCEVWFRSEEMELDIFESARCNGLWWTECSREAIFDALMPRLAARGGFLAMDYVPREAWLKMRVHCGGNPYITFVRMGMADNAHNLNTGELEFQKATLTDEQYRVRVLGEDGSDFGVVFKEFRPRSVADAGHIEDDFILPRDWPAWVYCDVGKYTAALLTTVNEQGRKYIVDEVYTLGLNITENAEQIKAMLERHGRKPHQVTEYKMDPAAWAYSAANQVNVAEQYQAQGLPFSGWTPTQTYGEHAILDRMRVEFMNDRLRVCQRCEKTVMELQTWRHKTDKDGKVDPHDRFDGPNHTIDAAKAWVMTNPTFDQPALRIIDLPQGVL